MRLGLRMGLNSRQGGGGALDPDARLYIAAVETALGTPIATALPSATSNPKRIISDFIKAEKAASRWSLHKRIFLPIYNNAAASAVDMVSRTSGTFTGLGSVTHAAGYVQGDGTSGYFNMGISANTAGVSITNASLVFLSPQADSRIDARGGIGAYMTANQEHQFYSSDAANLRFDAFNNSTGLKTAPIARASQTGVLIATRNDDGWIVSRRSSSGISTLHSSVGSGVGAIPTINYFAMGTNLNGGVVYPSNAQFGVWGVGFGTSEEQTAAYSANLKTLWESLTGLTLP